MTAQEIFTKVATHLLAQGRRATVGDICRYRTEDGLMCAVGALIPDNLYTPELEGTSVIGGFPYLQSRSTATRKLGTVFHALGLLEHTHLLEQLQVIHDAYSVDNWPQLLAAIAQQYKLEMPK